MIRDFILPTLRAKSLQRWFLLYNFAYDIFSRYCLTSTVSNYIVHILTKFLYSLKYVKFDLTRFMLLDNVTYWSLHLKVFIKGFYSTSPPFILVSFGKTLIYICRTSPRWSKWVPGRNLFLEMLERRMTAVLKPG